MGSVSDSLIASSGVGGICTEGCAVSKAHWTAAGGDSTSRGGVLGDQAKMSSAGTRQTRFILGTTIGGYDLGVGCAVDGVEIRRVWVTAGLVGSGHKITE